MAEYPNKPKAFHLALAKIRDICERFPEFAEVEAWQHPTFRAGKKMFAALGGRDGEDPALGMKFKFERQGELLDDARFFPTPYSAHQGWASTAITAKTNWSEIAGLLKEAYSTVANKRMLQALAEAETRKAEVAASKTKPRRS